MSKTYTIVSLARSNSTNNVEHPLALRVANGGAAARKKQMERSKMFAEVLDFVQLPVAMSKEDAAQYYMQQQGLQQVCIPSTKGKYSVIALKAQSQETQDSVAENAVDVTIDDVIAANEQQAHEHAQAAE